jgi:hypothetical protein
LSLYAGIFSGTYEDWGNKLYTLWFGQYVRKGALSTSGFEHVFIGQFEEKGSLSNSRFEQVTIGQYWRKGALDTTRFEQVIKY